jgi:hypothetical protein
MSQISENRATIPPYTKWKILRRRRWLKFSSDMSNSLRDAGGTARGIRAGAGCPFEYTG